MGLLKFILYAIIIYYSILFLSRFLFRFLLKRWAYKFQKNMKTKSSSENYKERKEGETVVQYKKENGSKSDPGGEYVDFEDLNDH
tara:strand:- start:90 stop:344 length:255 start_codon:yes stop_codon:yes gene_type:complete